MDNQVKNQSEINRVDVLVYQERTDNGPYTNPSFVELISTTQIEGWYNPGQMIGSEVKNGNNSVNRYQHPNKPWIVRTERVPVGGLSSLFTLKIWVELPVPEISEVK